MASGVLQKLVDVSLVGSARFGADIGMAEVRRAAPPSDGDNDIALLARVNLIMWTHVRPWQGSRPGRQTLTIAPKRHYLW